MNYKTNNSSILIEKIKNFVNSINVNKNVPLICKYLTYFSLFDILGKYTFPNENSHREKYKKLIDYYSSWKTAKMNYRTVKRTIEALKEKQIIGVSSYN